MMIINYLNVYLMTMSCDKALHISQIVNAASEQAFKASISTPVLLLHVTLLSITTYIGGLLINRIGEVILRTYGVTLQRYVNVAALQWDLMAKRNHLRRVFSRHCTRNYSCGEYWSFLTRDLVFLLIPQSGARKPLLSTEFLSSVYQSDLLWKLASLLMLALGPRVG